MSIQEFHGLAYDETTPTPSEGMGYSAEDQRSEARHWQPQVSEETLMKATEGGGYLLRTKIRAAIEFLDQLYQYGEAGPVRIGELGREVFDEEDVPEIEES